MGRRRKVDQEVVNEEVAQAEVTESEITEDPKTTDETLEVNDNDTDTEKDAIDEIEVDNSTEESTLDELVEDNKLNTNDLSEDDNTEDCHVLSYELSLPEDHPGIRGIMIPKYHKDEQLGTDTIITEISLLPNQVFCLDIDNRLDVEYYINYYESLGLIVTKV